MHATMLTHALDLFLYNAHTETHARKSICVDKN